MNFSKPFILRPVATTLMVLAFVIFGWFAYRALPVNELPNIDFPTIVVSAGLPGADPETMASTVATPLERQFSQIAGIDNMNSESSAGLTKITLQFDLSRNVDAAAQDVQTAISQAARKLPTNMPAPPTLNKVNPAQSPILFIAMTADHLPLTTLDDYAETYIGQRLSMISGVAQVNVFGGQQYAVRILVNPNALASRGLDIATLASALQSENVNLPCGTLRTDGYYHLIKTKGQLNNAQEFNQAVLTSVNGADIRLKDIGYAIDNVANDQVATWYNHEKAIVLAIQRQPGSNTVEIINNIKQVLPELTKQLPGGVHLKIIYDRSVFIKKSLHEMNFTLLLAIFLVLLVTYLFLNNFSATLITLLDFPTSLIATFGVMYLLSYSLNNLSLMGLVLAVGFVIDDTIVVLENILRFVEQGYDRLTAAIRATQEISFTVVSMTLSLIAAFIPIIFMGGILGRLFHEFAVVVSTAILFSGFIALTFTPMLRSRFLAKTSHGTANPLINNFTKFFDYSKEFYLKTLRWSLDNSNIVLGFSVIILVATIGLFYWIPKGFIPSEDTGMIFGGTEVKEGLNFPDFLKRQRAIGDIILKNPNVESLLSAVGQGRGANPSGNTGQVFIHLKPLSERHANADEIIEQLQKELNKISSIKVFLTNPPVIRIGAMSSISNYQYVLQGTDWDKLQKYSQLLQEKINAIPGVQDLDSDLKEDNPELRVKILRDRAALLGISPDQIETTLFSAYGQRQISSIMTPTNDYEVLIEVDPKYQKNIDALNNLELKSASGKMVPLSAVVNITEGIGPLTVNHYGQLPAVTLSFNLAKGVSLSAATQKITQLANKILPSDITGSFVGSAQTFQSSMQNLFLLLFFTVIVIYMVLGVLYEHFIHPLTILTALPFATFGALFVLVLFHQELNIFSFIGIIMLVGLVKKNGIMMIDFALNAKRLNALSARDAIFQACEVRYRPIMMTSMAAILATLPIALGVGAGGESRRALGITVVGGLLFSQTFTLYVTPVFYLLMDKLSIKISEFRKTSAISSTVNHDQTDVG